MTLSLFNYIELKSVAAPKENKIIQKEHIFHYAVDSIIRYSIHSLSKYLLGCFVVDTMPN